MVQEKNVVDVNFMHEYLDECFPMADTPFAIVRGGGGGGGGGSGGSGGGGGGDAAAKSGPAEPIDPRKRITVNGVRLMRNLSFLIPGEIVVSSTPKSAAQVAALSAAPMNVGLVVTLTEEEPLSPAWFGLDDVEDRAVLPYDGGVEEERNVRLQEHRQRHAKAAAGWAKGGKDKEKGKKGRRKQKNKNKKIEDGGKASAVGGDLPNNVFAPVPNWHPPTIEQMDMIVEKVGEEIVSNGRAVLIHCGGGKGRAGTVAACLLLRFGFQGIAACLMEEQQNAFDQSGGGAGGGGGGGIFEGAKMSSAAAIKELRRMRPGSLETDIQENFVRQYANILWKRAVESQAEAEETAKAAAEARRKDWADAGSRENDVKYDLSVEAAKDAGRMTLKRQSSQAGEAGEAAAAAAAAVMGVEEGGGEVVGDEGGAEVEGAAGAASVASTVAATAAAATTTSSKAAAKPKKLSRKERAAAAKAIKAAKAARKRSPRFVMCVGLPGSGKSTFAKKLVSGGGGDWVRANQDEQGRAGCFAVISRASRDRARKHLVIDRCNVTAKDRREVLETMFKPDPKSVCAVYFEVDPETCARRWVDSGGGGGERKRGREEEKEARASASKRTQHEEGSSTDKDTRLPRSPDPVWRHARTTRLSGPPRITHASARSSTALPKSWRFQTLRRRASLGWN